MRGLDVIEWESLESAAQPDPCDELWECEDCSVDQEAAEDRLVRRGLAVIVPCVYAPEDTHLALTSAGTLLLSLGPAIVVGSGVPR